MDLHSFRSRTFQFEDFIIAWSDRLKACGEHTALTAKIQKDIDKFQVSDNNKKQQNKKTFNAIFIMGLLQRKGT